MIPAAALGTGLFFIPNSPRWLAARGHIDQASAVLKKIRAPEQVEEELAQIRQSAGQKKGRWSELGGELLRPAMIVGIGLVVAQQVVI